VGDEWYEPLSSLSVTESDYEQSVIRYAENLFPGYLCVPFNELVESPHGQSRADLALIDRRYRGWVVVEVELDHHSLSRHVEPQLRRLSNGRYEDRHAQAMCRMNSLLDPLKTEVMVRSAAPEFMVIVPREMTEWRTTLSNMGIKLTTLQVFASRTGKRVVQQAGDKPREWEDEILTRLLRNDGFAARGLRVESPGCLTNLAQVSIISDGQITTWRVVRTKSQMFIFPDGRFEPQQDGGLALTADNDGNFILREVQQRV